jgi:predicted nucleotidyltransferase
VAVQTVDRKRLPEICQRYGVRLDVFGSVARGTAEPESDLDLLDTLAPGAQLGGRRISPVESRLLP